jgi:site-specific recombinase XerD
MKNSVYLFVRKDYKKLDGNYPIYLRLVIKTLKKDFSTGISIPNPDLFDVVKQQIRGIKYTNENTILFSFKNRADKIILDYVLNKKQLTFEIFDRLFKQETYNKDSFYDFALEEIKLMTGTVSDSYIRQLKVEVSKLKQFKKSLTFDEITIRFIQKYEQYMRTVLNNKTNTVGKSMKRIKMLIAKAIKNELMSKNPFDSYKIKAEPSNRIFLSIDEVNLLQKLYDSNCLKNNHQKVLHYFLFSCYTGLRYGDLNDFGMNKIEKNGNDYIINLVMEKTRGSVRIPMTEKAINLIKDKMIDDKPFFELYTGQVSNRFLREIIKIADINKKISFHCARHTFATIALTIGVPLVVVSKLLGHTDIRTTEIYAKVIDTLKIEEMKKFNKI